MKRVSQKVAVLAATLALILFSLTPANLTAQGGTPYYVDIWEGRGTGKVYCGEYEVYIYPWEIWWIHDYHPYPSGTNNIFENESGWSSTASCDGGIAGEVNVETFAASGTWDTDYPYGCDIHGTWSGVFNRLTKTASGTWYYYNASDSLVYGGTFSGTLVRTETRY